MMWGSIWGNLRNRGGEIWMTVIWKSVIWVRLDTEDRQRREGGILSSEIWFLHWTVEYFHTNFALFDFCLSEKVRWTSEGKRVSVTMRRCGQMKTETGGVSTGVSVVCCGLSGSVIWNDLSFRTDPTSCDSVRLLCGDKGRGEKQVTEERRRRRGGREWTSPVSKLGHLFKKEL